MPESLTCQHCQTGFPRPRRAGRPPAFCGDECRRAGRTGARGAQREAVGLREATKETHARTRAVAARAGLAVPAGVAEGTISPNTPHPPRSADRYDAQRHHGDALGAGSLVYEADVAEDHGRRVSLADAGLVPDTWAARKARPRRSDAAAQWLAQHHPDALADFPPDER